MVCSLPRLRGLACSFDHPKVSHSPHKPSYRALGGWELGAQTSGRRRCFLRLRGLFCGDRPFRVEWACGERGPFSPYTSTPASDFSPTQWERPAGPAPTPLFGSFPKLSARNGAQVPLSEEGGSEFALSRMSMGNNLLQRRRLFLPPPKDADTICSLPRLRGLACSFAHPKVSLSPHKPSYRALGGWELGLQTSWRRRVF